MNSLASQFAAWCRSKPADETYDFTDAYKCAFYQFAIANGLPDPVRTWNPALGVGLPADLRDPLATKPFTFSALADRVERQIDELGVMGASLRDRVLAVPAEPAAQSHRFALRPTGARSEG